MNNSSFAHLHNHNEYSFLDGVGTSASWCEKAASMGFKALGLTNHGNISGLIKFQNACIENELLPVLGCEGYVVEKPFMKEAGEERGHITLLVKNMKGWINLCQLLTKASLDHFYSKPRFGVEDLYAHCEGLVIMSACSVSCIKYFWGMEVFEKLGELIPGDVYLEVMPHCFDITTQFKDITRINQIAVQMNEKHGFPLVATNDCHYIEKDDWEVQEVLLAIKSKSLMSDSNRFKFKLKGLHLRSTDEMIKAFEEEGTLNKRQVLRAMATSMEVVEKCSGFRIEKRQIRLPAPDLPGFDGSLSENEVMEDICIEGIKKKAVAFGFGKKDLIRYQARMREELDLIFKKKFARYFLIVWDVVNYCRREGIPVGPGRGSVGGSLVAYLMELTSIDPIKHDLLFSRFISEDRIDYPDIDIDFAGNKRHLVADYLKDKYGEDNIYTVSTFGRMKAKAAVRDVARVFEENEAADDLCKFIETYDDGEKVLLPIIFEETETGRQFKRVHPEIARFAMRVENQIRGVGQHAAAVIISEQPIADVGKGSLVRLDKGVAVCWEKEDAEYMGLMKLDVLGVKIMSIIDLCIRMIKRNYGVKVDLEIIDLEDKKVYRDINRGMSKGAFQIATWAMTNLIQEMGVANFEQLSAAVALVRPGPYHSGMTDTYIARKHGDGWALKHEQYEKITEKTFGVIVYQEQVMAVINKVAGLPYVIADKIRKIIGKKRDKAEFEKYRFMFTKGCLRQHTLSKEEANEFWEMLQEHASYSFNKCLSGDTVVYKGSSGGVPGGKREITLNEIYDVFQSKTSTGTKYRNGRLTLLKYGEDGEIRPGFLKDIHFNGIKNVYEVVTESGKKIKATIGHRFLTPVGYKRVKNLFVGCEIFINSGKRKREEISKKKRKFKGYEGRGFLTGENNPSYIDGRRKQFEDSCDVVFKRSKGCCEFCGNKKKGRFEFAHIRGIYFCDNDFLEYHSSNNLLYLCNSCHKKFDYAKGERVKRFSFGYEVVVDKIKSIEFVGKEKTFDLEMADTPHNFVANDFISHNSHSCAYAMLGFWTAWLKYYYPLEFMCSSLTFCAKEKKASLIDEAIELGFEIMTPKIGISRGMQWEAKKGKLYVPFLDVNGIGDKSLPIIANIHRARTMKGFYKKKNNPLQMKEVKGSLGKILKRIEAYNPDSKPKNIEDLFKFSLR